ncbi:hypothetical protein [Flavobacterium sp.]|uniref:hypothetical protein n=1 Tax=Flavobacterium sp. TaxID=239 RepID=UPI003D09CC29
MRNYFFEYFKLKIEEKDYGSYKTEFENLIEFTFKENDNFWKWWAITKENKIVIVSLNKKTEVTNDNIMLLRRMINSLNFH